MKKLFLAALFLFALPALTHGQTNSPLVMYPSVSPDGSTVAFSYQGDIWTVPSTGGKAYRITIHEAYDGMPKWSPDGSMIAFTSDRWGNNDVYVMPAEGGTPKRLTYYSGNDNNPDWAGNGSILFSTERVFNQIEWDPEVWIISGKGGTPQRQLDAFGDMAVQSPDGRFTAYVEGACRLEREDYRGSANKDIWIYDSQNNRYNQITNHDGNDFYPQFAGDNTIYYISAASGRYNVYRIGIDASGNATGTPEQLTNYTDDGVRYLELSEDGSTAVFARQADAYVMNTASGQVNKLNVEISADYRFDPVKRENFSRDAESFNVSPNGKYAVLVIHGEVFITETEKEESKTVNLSKHPYRDQDAVFLNDSTILYCSDRDGQFDIYMVQSADAQESNLFKSLKHKTTRLTDTETDESNLVVSHDGKKIAYIEGNGRLVVYDAEGGNLSNRVVLQDGWDTPGFVSFSPDDKWLTYGTADLTFNNEVYIHAVDGSSKPVNVSMHPKSEYGAVWSPDGSKLGFYSPRNNGDNDIWFVWLNREDWLKSKDEWDEADDEKDDKDTTDKDIQIDFKDIHERIVQVTSLPGAEGNIAFSEDGETIYFTASSNTAKGNDLYSVKWDGTDIKELTSGGQNPYGISLGPKGKYLYLLKTGGRFAKFSVSAGKMENLSFTAKMDIDFDKEQDQVFEEAWRTLYNGFYDPDFHGQNFTALKSKYKPWAMAAKTKTDFRYIFNWMLGQLNASHMGLYGGDRAETQRDRTGRIGVEVEPVSNGAKITRIVPNTPADKESSKLNVGDVITAVNQQKVTSTTNLYELLNNTADERVLLNIEGKGGSREVVIRPVSSIGTQLYEEWISNKKALTEKYSNGRLGYIHIRAMGWDSFERFERELMAAGYGKDGIVIDVRYNGGGWTTDYMMAILDVRQHAYTIPRGSAKNLEAEKRKFREYYPYAERLPFFPLMKPSVAMCNSMSYSNAEIFSHAYKTLNIGTLVGEPTFGAVISTGGQGLIDGSFVRLPFRGWYVKATDDNMDFQAAVPDVIVDLDPVAKSKGEDNQLKTAVDELLKELGN